MLKEFIARLKLISLEAMPRLRISQFWQCLQRREVDPSSLSCRVGSKSLGAEIRKEEVTLRKIITVLVIICASAR
jgi:hypothetical protein